MLFKATQRIVSIVSILLLSFTVANAQLTVAVLPFEVSTNDGNIMIDAMGNEMQNEFVQSMRQNAPKAKMQDARMTNSILAKNNVTLDNIATMAPNELVGMLGVQFVVYGNANVQNKGVTSSTTSTTTYSDKNNQNKTNTSVRKGNANASNSNKKSESKGYSTSGSTTTVKTEYQTRLGIDIYNRDGENVHSVTRTGFSQELNGYIGTVHYLVKRTPFGKKYKAR